MGKYDLSRGASRAQLAGRFIKRLGSLDVKASLEFENLLQQAYEQGLDAGFKAGRAGEAERDKKR
jgi:hypothetical protein